MVGLNMKTDNIWAKAGLIFTRFRDLDVIEVANHVVASFEALGHHVTSRHILSDNRAMVTTKNQELYLQVKDDVAVSALSDPAESYLAVSIANKSETETTKFARDSILARVLQTLHLRLQPDFVKWIDSDVILSSAEFAKAIGPAETQSAKKPVRPRRVTCNKALPDVEETNNQLHRRITENDPSIFDNVSSPERLRKVFVENWVDPDILATNAATEALAREEEDIEKVAPLRLSAWIMSFAVVLFALPIGITLLVLNLAKGENLRLASQTAALTGTFIAFQTFGTTPHAMTALQDILN